MIDEKKLIQIMLIAREREFGVPLAMINWFLDMIVAQPKVGEWIPCIEKLPKEKEDVLISTYRSEVVIVNMQKDLGGNIYFEESFDGVFTWELVDVIAWQPLPKPYEEEKDE